MGKECVFGAGFLKRPLLRRDRGHASLSMGMVSTGACRLSEKAVVYNDGFAITLMP